MNQIPRSDLHSDAIVIDGLNVSQWCEDTFRQLSEGGVTAINATIAVHEGFREAVAEISRWQRLFERYPSLIVPARSVDDVRQAQKDGRVGIIFGFQSADPIEKDLHLLGSSRSPTTSATT